MLPGNGYDQYAKNKILTASPAELTLMLYEGAIKFCNIAEVAIEKKEIEKAHTNIMKAQRIVDELKYSLNDKYPVAKDFENVYNYIGDVLIRANLHKDVKELEEALKQLRVMRDTWKEVMRLAGAQGSRSIAS